MHKKYYTGVGSRKTPHDVMNRITTLARQLDSMGFVLRSGGANGADTAFENDAYNKEIYLPWKGFNNNSSDLFNVCDEAIKMARFIHPIGKSLTGAALKLHARNCYQVLGGNLNTPSKFLICWTPNGDIIGGTATTIRLAHLYGIEIFNLGKKDD